MFRFLKAFALPEYDIHYFREHTDVVMYLGVLANGPQKALPAHGNIVVPSAHVLLQSSVDQKPGIVGISHSPIGRMSLDIPSHVLQGSGKGALPLVPGPDGRCGQGIGATLDRKG